jgi:hypothetical protein
MEYSQIETKIIKDITSLLESYKYRFDGNSLTYKVRLKTESDQNLENYFSEIEIVFYKFQKIYDIIEFFVFRNGKLYIQEENLMNNLKNDFEKLLTVIN